LVTLTPLTKSLFGPDEQGRCRNAKRARNLFNGIERRAALAEFNERYEIAC
jgi:hypothetical protein